LKPEIYLGIHAREWIALASALYLIDQLVRMFSSNNTTDPRVNVNWYIIPLLNPDGYEYTHQGDRMWRKNRSPPPSGRESLIFKVRQSSEFDVSQIYFLTFTHKAAIVLALI